MTIIMGKHMASMLIAEVNRRGAPGCNLRSGNLGLYPPVDGDGGADGKVGNNHYTRVEEDKRLRCYLRIKMGYETHNASDSIGDTGRCRHVVTCTLVSDCLDLST